MSALPIRIAPAPATFDLPPSRELPDYLPARMVNEFVYCPRLFFYEWVDGIFRESADTLGGAAQHKRVDARPTALRPAPLAENPAAPPATDFESEKIHARSVTLSSERLRVIATLDLVEAQGQTATPVDYKHGAPRDIGTFPRLISRGLIEAVTSNQPNTGCTGISATDQSRPH